MWFGCVIVIGPEVDGSMDGWVVLLCLGEEFGVPWEVLYAGSWQGKMHDVITHFRYDAWLE